MNIFLFVVGGLFAGAVAGMGMGGGTLLIPILTLLASVSQHEAQALNMISFIPAAIMAIIIHKKAGRIHFKECIPIILYGFAFALLGSLLAIALKGNYLRIAFAILLFFLSIRQFIASFRDNCNANATDTKNTSDSSKQSH